MKISTSLILVLLTFSLAACSSQGTSMYQNQSIAAIPSSSSLFSSSLSSSSSSAISNTELYKDLYRYYESKDLGLSFYYPAEYVFMRTYLNEKMDSDTPPITFDEVYVATGEGGEDVQINMLKTHDSRILKQFSADHPLTTVTINGKRVFKFQEEGVGSPVGFIEKINTEYIVITFDFAPGKNVMERVFESIKEI